ncbi:MAG: nitroreductase family protein [Aestuariivirga sp.]
MDRGGAEAVFADTVRSVAKFDFLAFAETRHSIRQYASEPVPMPAIERAVRVAQQTPSSCNRQTCRVWVWTNPDDVRSVLALQIGNRGFGDQLGGLAIITSDLSHWQTSSERYQAWIDGGLFAMSFTYGLHAEGLGTVLLNWSVSRHQDRALRNLIGLPDSEQVITMVGFGVIPENLTVPVSQRKPVGMALTVNSPLLRRRSKRLSVIR